MSAAVPASADSLPPADATARDADLAAALPRFPRRPHAEEVRRLSKVNNMRSVWLLSRIVLIVVGALVLAASVPLAWSSWWVYLIAGLLIGSQQVAMGVLLHDAAHYLLFTNRTVNDIVSDLVLGFPIGMSTTLYRKTHFQHHRFTNTDQDGDLAAQKTDVEWFEWPKTRRGLVGVLIRSLTGLNAYRAWVMYKHWAPWKHLWTPLSPAFPLRARLLYVGCTIAVYSLLIWGFNANSSVALLLMLIYVLPGLTIVNLAMRLRGTAEHLGAPNHDELTATRTVLPRWWERWLIAPVNVSYHLEHHLFPSVPGPNLSQLHETLMQDQGYRDHALLTHGYTGVIEELMADVDE